MQDPKTYSESQIPLKQPALTENHKEKRIVRVKQYVKIDFSKVISIGKCHATLDGPDG